MSFFTNNRWLPVITLLLLTANIVTLGFLWTHKNINGGVNMPPPPQGAQGPVFEFVSSELQLDSSQKIAYAKLRDEHQAGQRPLQDSIRSAKEALFELLKMPAAPDSLIQAASNKAAAADAQLELLTFKHFQSLRAICNVAQQKKFDEIIQDVLKRMAIPRGRNPQGPPAQGMHGDRPPPPGEGEGPEGGMPPPREGHGDKGMPPPPPGNK